MILNIDQIVEPAQEFLTQNAPDRGIESMNGVKRVRDEFRSRNPDVAELYFINLASGDQNHPRDGCQLDAKRRLQSNVSGNSGLHRVGLCAAVQQETIRTVTVQVDSVYERTSGTHLEPHRAASRVEVSCEIEGDYNPKS
jgi:hypothetical protein